MTLAYLETIFCHHDLSIQLVTQTVDEFVQRPEAATKEQDPSPMCTTVYFLRPSQG